MGMVCGRGKRNAKQATNTTRVLFAEQIRSDWSRAKRAEQREQSKESRAKHLCGAPDVETDGTNTLLIPQRGHLVLRKQQDVMYT